MRNPVTKSREATLEKTLSMRLASCNVGLTDRSLRTRRAAAMPIVRYHDARSAGEGRPPSLADAAGVRRSPLQANVLAQRRPLAAGPLWSEGLGLTACASPWPWRRTYPPATFPASSAA